MALSEAELAAEQLRSEIEGDLKSEREKDAEIAALSIEEEDGREGTSGTPAQADMLYVRPGKKDERERQKIALRDVQERAGNAKGRSLKGTTEQSKEDRQESELLKENQRGFGSEKETRSDRGIDDDQELGR